MALPQVPAWLMCPNDPPCRHTGLLHDIDEPGDPSPACCVEGCPCGKPTDALPDLEITITADFTRWDAGVRRVLLTLGTRYIVKCPGCRREVCCHEYNLSAESCRACLEVIPRLQKTMRGAWVDWAPASPELHWRSKR